MGKMVELAVYFELWGWGEDEDGNKDWAGAKLTLGKVDEAELPNYDEFVSELDKQELLDIIKVKLPNMEDMRFITKEKFEELYGDDEDDCEDLALDEDDE